MVAFISIRMYTYIYMCTHIRRNERGLTPERADYVCLCVCIFAFIPHICTYIKTDTHTYICIHTNTYESVNTHTYIHT